MGNDYMSWTGHNGKRPRFDDLLFEGQICVRSCLFRTCQRYKISTLRDYLPYTPHCCRMPRLLDSGCRLAKQNAGRGRDKNGGETLQRGTGAILISYVLPSYRISSSRVGRAE